MVKQKGISKKTLNDVIKGFPAPIQDHLRRVRQLTAFVLERVRGEDWFLDLEMNPDDIESASFYHDIGKLFLKKDYYYYLYCNNVKEKDVYRTHVDEGVKYLKKEFGVTPDTVAPNSFDGILLSVVGQHHEYPNGRGYPDKLKGEQISFPARLVATVDRFDNLLFLNAKNEFNFEKAVNELKALAGSKVDKDVVDILTDDVFTLEYYVDYIRLGEKERHKQNEFGIQYNVYGIKNIRKNENSALFFDYSLNDQFYGKLE
ncbi:MAG: HD domain-containing protein, partial [Clostridia bacterium]|nr:HD domain-containing protein [Clostridia bacterium]